MDAHLLFQRSALHAVARTERAVGVDQELGDDEQADAFDPGGRIRQPRQYQVDNVFRQVMLTGRDEDLGAADPVAAVRLRLSAAAQQAKVGAAMGFGEVHGAGPAPGDHRRQEQGLLLGAAAIGDGIGGAMAQACDHGKGQVGAGHDLAHRDTQYVGQALAAVVG
ncbi:hypothetical protein D3C77_334320 [compost metagenome]